MNGLAKNFIEIFEALISVFFVYSRKIGIQKTIDNLEFLLLFGLIPNKNFKDFLINSLHSSSRAGY